jgi:hypothetical protein
LKKRKKQTSRRKNGKYKTENEYKKTESPTEQVQQSKVESNKCQSLQSSNKRLKDASAGVKDSFEKVDLSVYSISEGVDNLTFNHSDADIQIIDENNCSSEKLQTDKNVNVSTCQKTGLKKDLSYEKTFESDMVSKRLPNDRFVIRKIMRRHSYELAVCEDSWMPLDSPCCSRTKLENSHIDEIKKDKNTFNVSFENQAYDKDDLENT